MIDALTTVLVRELGALAREIAAYPDDASPWLEPAGVPNSAGTLALHAAGNLQHFVGAVLGGNGYVRDREAEFGRRGVSREALIAELSTAADAVREVLGEMDPDALRAPYPLELAGRQVRTVDFLAHLATHLAYHLGQVDYHRRILTSSGESVDAVSLSGLDIPPRPDHI